METILATMIDNLNISPSFLSLYIVKCFLVLEHFFEPAFRLVYHENYRMKSCDPIKGIPDTNGLESGAIPAHCTSVFGFKQSPASASRVAGTTGRTTTSGFFVLYRRGFTVLARMVSIS
ncbi:hypothetical protein AAY473_000550 [Plecturocebus cupreus]